LTACLLALTGKFRFRKTQLAHDEQTREGVTDEVYRWAGELFRPSFAFKFIMFKSQGWYWERFQSVENAFGRMKIMALNSLYKRREQGVKRNRTIYILCVNLILF
ncbi:hypothetical protein, partial [Yanghanlia caeni]|nr:hypothetical protein [Alcaligenaceae bacterium LG-2]